MAGPKREVRGSRLSDTWDATNIHEVESKPWVQSRALPQIPTRAGFVQRWIRVSALGIDDPNNVARKTTSGWKPRDPSTIPPNLEYPTIAQGEWAGCVGVQGSILCEMPESLAKKFRHANSQKNKRQNDGIKARLQQEEQPYTHISQERSSESGFARAIKVADD